MTDDSTQRQLVWHGIFLFLIGLLSGFAIPALTNPRLGLSAHMEALLNGMLLVLLGGVVWKYLRLSGRMERVVFWLFIYAAYANWFFCLLAAIFGANTMLPLASGERTVALWQEIPVRIGLGIGALCITSACILVLYGMKSKTSNAN